MPERDLFANFERMQREMAELMPRRTGFSPAVDVYYHGNPPTAVVRVELAGIDPDAADASYEDGILTVELPLKRPAQPRSVPIRGTDR